MCDTRKVILLGYFHNFITSALVLISTIHIFDTLMIPVSGFIGSTMAFVLLSLDNETGNLIITNIENGVSLQEAKALLPLLRKLSEIAKLATEQILIFIVATYILFVLAHYIIQQSFRIKNNNKLIENISTKNMLIFISKEKETNSFRIARKKYVFLSVAEYFKSKGHDDDLNFIIAHEIFHTICFDGIIRRFIIISSFTVPVFMVVYPILIRFIPYYFSWFDSLLIENNISPVFAKNRQEFDYFIFGTSLIVLAILLSERKSFLSSFFYYKEFLADRYAMLKTNHIFKFKNRTIGDVIYHPSFGSRILAMKNNHSVLKVDYYFYLISTISTIHDYKYIATFVGILFFLLFFIWQHDMYLSLKGLIVSLTLIFLVKLSFGNIFSEEYRGFIKYDYFDWSSYSLIIVLVLSFFIPRFSKRQYR